MTHYFDEENWEHQVSDTQDVEILMHREAHFGGNFDVMIDYYQKDGKGCSPNINASRIVELAELEKSSGENMAAVMLTAADAEKIHKIRETYKTLRDVYEVKEKSNPIPTLIADLILSEEIHPETEIKAFLPYKQSSVTALMDLLKNPDFYDPLFPGYGYAPEHAAEILAHIGDRRAIIALFEAIGEGDFFNDEGILRALKAIGEPAKEFLLKVLQGRPFNEDNEKAAIALENFKGDETVGNTALELLQDPAVLKDHIFSTYLVFLCEDLPQHPYKEKLLAVAKVPNLSKELLRDIQVVAKTML